MKRREWRECGKDINDAKIININMKIITQPAEKHLGRLESRLLYSTSFVLEKLGLLGKKRLEKNESP